MLKTIIPESLALDMLSIMMVKAENTTDKRLKSELAGQIQGYIKLYEEQVGAVKMAALLASEEFAKLKEANQTVYNLVDILNKKVDISGMIVNNFNNIRFKWKNKLQAKFFPNSPGEIKIGVK